MIGAMEAIGVEARAEAGPGLYVHVPFCSVRCAYCDFSSGAVSRRAMEAWFGAIEREMDLRAPLARGVAFRSLFFGGGTPSALGSRQFGRLWSGLRARFLWAAGAEITLEANPESVRESLLDTWREAGVNRLSLGVQSFLDDELRRLGRVHGAAQADRAFARARAAGFDNVSLDLMFAFPGHTLARWRETLDRALTLLPEHLSAYCYIPEEGTPMGGAVLRGALRLPSPGEQSAMYDALRQAAAAAGYVHYEISNFARPGRASRHNLTYWLRRDYLGLGPSAHSLWREERWGNPYAREAYARRLAAGRDPAGERETCAAQGAAGEAVFLGLRLVGGMRLADYRTVLRAEIAARFGPALDHAARRGELRAGAGTWALAPSRLFVADEVLAWILARAECEVAVTGRVDSGSEARLVS
jgi:oxygen-independent coproporphyrinogen-3 oxidase